MRRISLLTISGLFLVLTSCVEIETDVWMRYEEKTCSKHANLSNIKLLDDLEVTLDEQKIDLQKMVLSFDATVSQCEACLVCATGRVVEVLIPKADQMKTEKLEFVQVSE